MSQRLWFRGLVVVVALASAEAAARLDDWVRFGVPMSATPDEPHDLTVHDSLGVHGRPNGRFRYWRLNAFGFRGPEITAAPLPGCTRVMIVGASETFGLYESPGHEYPAQLRDRVRGNPCIEVINAAMAGATVHSMIGLWDYWIAPFAPRIAIVYANPSFYLSPAAVGTMGPHRAHARARGDTVDRRPPWWTPRLLDRAHQAFHYPSFIQRRRVVRLLRQETAGHDSTWFFAGVPPDRLAQYTRDLDSLTASICARGVTAVLVTHAMPFTNPPRPSDRDLLLEWQTYNPQATPATLLAFEDSAAAATRRVAAAHGARLIDAAGALNGTPSYFADFTHFTDRGSAAFADLLATILRTIALSADTGCRPR